MTLDIDKLEALAKAVLTAEAALKEMGGGFNLEASEFRSKIANSKVDFQSVTIPEAVPALIAQVRELGADRDRLKNDMGIVCRLSNPDWREKRTDMEQCLNEIHGNAVASYWFHNRRILKGDKT
jgi:hypothetical protein